MRPRNGSTHQITKNSLDTFAQIQARLEQIRLEFTVTHIDTSWTFARSAETLYESGSPNADRLASKAREAYGEAASNLRTVSVDGSQRRRLSDKLNQIREMLEALPPSPTNGNKRAQLVSKNGEG